MADRVIIQDHEFGVYQSFEDFRNKDAQKLLDAYSDYVRELGSLDVSEEDEKKVAGGDVRKVIDLLMKSKSLIAGDVVNRICASFLDADPQEWPWEKKLELIEQHARLKDINKIFGFFLGSIVPQIGRNFEVRAAEINGEHPGTGGKN